MKVFVRVCESLDMGAGEVHEDREDRGGLE